jgi:hypothetical protein
MSSWWFTISRDPCGRSDQRRLSIGSARNLSAFPSNLPTTCYHFLAVSGSASIIQIPASQIWMRKELGLSIYTVEILVHITGWPVVHPSSESDLHLRNVCYHC